MTATVQTRHTKVLAINLDTKAEEAAEALEAVNLINIINAGTQEMLEMKEEKMKAKGLTINLRHQGRGGCSVSPACYMASPATTIVPLPLT